MAEQPTHEIPTCGRLLGVDFGTVRIGLAISDPSQSIASPLEIYRPRNLDLDARYFRELVARERIVGVIVGLPIHLDGRDSQVSVAAETFAGWLREVTNLPVTLFDERFTSAYADEIMREVGMSRSKRKQILDKLAAQILLTSYLESPRRSPPASKRNLAD